MSRRLTTLLIGILSFAAASGQTESDRTRANLIGAVKTVKESHYPYSDSKPKERDTVTYDVNGNEIERVMVSDFGELMGKQIQRFDTNGLIKETVFNDAKGNVKERSAYSFTNGKLTQILTFDGKGNLREKTTRTYNVNREFVEEVYFDPTTERAKTIFNYDEHGNAIEMAFFMSDGQKAIAPVGPCLGGHRVTFTYDKNNQPITKIVFDAKGNIKKTWTYSYDNNGNFAIYTIKSGSHATKISYSYEYDEKGNWIKQTAVTESDDGGLLDIMMKATGKPISEEARKKANEEIKKMSTRRTVTTRQITYY